MAQPLFSAPSGCEVFATVQAADCSVEHLMRCAGDDGVTSVELTGDGGTFISTVDAEAQWIYSYDTLADLSGSLVEPQADPSLLSDLLAGRNDYDFTTQGSDGTVTRFVGKEILSGGEVVIDGVTLLRTENRMQALAEDGTVLWSVVSQEYVNPEWRVFLGGTAVWNTPDYGEYPSDSTPVEIALPGQTGFLATVPAYGCAG
jgi:hypothetical protein